MKCSWTCSVFVLFLVNFTLLTTLVNSQLLIAKPNTSRPSDQIYYPDYLKHGHSGHSGHSGGAESHTTRGPNGGLTITIKLQPHVMAALQGKTHGIQADASYDNHAIVAKPYPQPNVYYGNYNSNHQHRGQSSNSVIQQSQPFNTQYGGPGPQNQHHVPYTTLPGQQLPPTPSTNPYDILSNGNLDNLIKDAMKDSENETPMFVNVASSVIKNVKDIPTNIDTMFNDMGRVYRKTLFKLKDTMKSSMPELLYKFGRGGSSYKTQYRDEFLDGYGV